jgi:preprotein translocase subunit SecF
MLKYRKIYFSFSIVLLVISIISLALWQLNFGIEFTGGSLLEVSFSKKVPEVGVIRKALEKESLESLVVQPTAQSTVILRFQEIQEETHQNVIGALQELAQEEQQDLEEKRYDAIGPVIGEELKRRTFWAIILSLIGIISYIAWAFKKVSWPIASWKYGLIAILTLFHDLIIVLGIFSILGRFANIEVGVPFVAALMTILGYSVNDTIVIFDRIRENLLKSYKEKFEDIINKSVRESYIRSLNTSLTTIIVLACIFFFGGATIRDFILALIAGIFLGTYSSLFVASPLLVMWESWKHRG